MWAHEMPSPPADEAKNMNHDEIDFYGTSKAYQARWDKVQTEKEKLYADLLEAEALWGIELRELFGELFKLENELFRYIRNYLQLTDPNSSEAVKRSLQKLLGKKRDIMYGTFSEEENDEFEAEFKAAMSNIEQQLKPKLSHAGA